MPPNAPPAPIDTIRLWANGTRLAQNKDLRQFSVKQSISSAAHANVRLQAADQAARTFKVGQTLKAAVVDPASGSEVTLFEGDIVSVALDWRAGRSELIVDAYDKSYQLARNTKVATFNDLSLRDIVQQIAREFGLEAQITKHLSNTTYPHAQRSGSAHRLLTDVCRMAGCEWWVEGSKLIVKPRSESTGAAIELSGLDTLRRFSARFSSMDQAADVTVRGWNSKTKQPVIGTVSDDDISKLPRASIVTEAAKSGHEAMSWPRQVAITEDVEGMATSVAARMAASVLTARGEAVVTPKVRPGTIVEITNTISDWNGQYYITEAEHLVGSDQPFITRFVAGSAEDESLPGMLGHGERASGSRFADGLTVGIVTNVSDADGMNRVKVKFPYLSDDIESAWARLVLPGAGKSRGLLIMPEIDDEVLVGFEHGDVRRPYVLGGLWNGKDAPPMPTSDAKLVNNGNVVTKSFTSRKGHVVSIVDGNADSDDLIVVALEGKRATLSLAHDAVALYHGQDVDLSITTDTASIKLRKGGDINIKGKNITIEAQQDIKLSGANLKVAAQSGVEATANAQVKLSGNGGVQVNSSGIVEIAGTMVKVN